MQLYHTGWYYPHIKWLYFPDHSTYQQYIGFKVRRPKALPRNIHHRLQVEVPVNLSKFMISLKN